MKRLLSFLSSAVLSAGLLAVLVTQSLQVPVACADQQTVDEGVDYGNTNSAAVQNIPGAASASDTPGFTGTQFPHTRYYHSGNTSAMQSEALNSIASGTANDAGLFAYDQATNPKLQFPDTDPLMQNSTTISTDAMTNPSVLTVPTGQCSVGDTTTPQTRLETCTAWMVPTHHACSEPLTVDVTWNETQSCVSGESYNEVTALHSTARVWDYMYARAFCNYGAPANTVSVQIMATDVNPPPICDPYTEVFLPESMPTMQYTGRTLAAKFTANCTTVPVFARGGCTGNDCSYAMAYYVRSTYSNGPPGCHRDGNCVSTCNGSVVNLSAMGFDGFGGGGQCVRGTSLTLAFQKPTRTRTPVVTESWGTGCDHLEAQVQ